MATLRSDPMLGLLEEALKVHGQKLRALSARARAGGDAELVHDVRVELRRLEALARLFRGVPGKGNGEAVREAARALRVRLSPLRSEEVGRELLAARAGEAGASLATVVFPGTLPAVCVEAADVAGVTRAVSGWRRLLASAFDGPFSPRAEGEAAVLERMRRRLRRRLGELRSLLPPKARTLHAARIAAKRVRYALEAVEPVEPDVFPLLRLLRSFQDAAGDAHDLGELAALVRAATPPDPAVGAAATLLAAELEADSVRALSVARRGGEALVEPVRRLRAALAAPETR